VIQKEHLAENAAALGEYIKDRLKNMNVSPFAGDVRGMGLLLAYELTRNEPGRPSLDSRMRVGNWIRNYCFDRGMILRNNGDILVIAPSLTITKAEADIMIDLIEEAIKAAAVHFGG
jgi:putrescine aminotransferase